MEPSEETQESPKREFPKPLEGVDWAEVRRACEAGLTLADASRVFGIDREAVKQRAWREEWLHPAKLAALKAEKLKLLENQQSSDLSPACNQRVETAKEALTGTLEGYRSQTLLSLAKLAKKGVETAVSANLNIENWQDAKIAAEIAMKLHQVGQEGVQVNICNAFADMDEGKLVETEIEVIRNNDDEGDDRNGYFIDAE